LLVKCLSRADQPDEQCLAPTTVLVVDDDAVSSRVLVTTLARADIVATSVPDPFQALDKLREHSYDVVLLDINLPGMSGLTLCEQMRKLRLHELTPVIFVTGHKEFEPRARSILNAGDDLISKPILPIELTVKVIAHVLNRRLRAEPAPAPPRSGPRIFRNAAPALATPKGSAPST
jgi:DNA-binding response OmpR family regulator